MMLRLRYILRLSFAFLKKFRAIISLGIILGLLVFYLFGRFNQIIFVQNKKVGLVGRYQPEDIPNTILNMVSQGLTKVDENGNLEPDLAKYWESPDKGKTWIFTLKDNLFWQDSKKIISKDINYQFTDLSVEKPNDKTIIFKLKDEYSPFPQVVSKPVFKSALLGTGEWRVKSLKLKQGIVESLTLKKKYNNVIYNFYPTEESVKLSFKLGKINTIEDIYNPYPFQSWNTVNINKSINLNQVVTLFLNTQDDLLSDKTIRQALNYAINKSDYKDTRALGPISPKSWAYNPQIKPYIIDLDKAKETINNLKLPKEKLKVNIVTSSLLLPEAEKISKEWQEIGLESSVLVSSVIPTEFQAYLAIYDIPTDPDQYFLWHSTQASNITKYINPRIDKLLEDGRSELDIINRKKIYFDFQRFLVEDCPAIFLYHPETYTIERK